MGTREFWTLIPVFELLFFPSFSRPFHPFSMPIRPPKFRVPVPQLIIIVVSRCGARVIPLVRFPFVGVSGGAKAATAIDDLVYPEPVPDQSGVGD